MEKREILNKVVREFKKEIPSDLLMFVLGILIAYYIKTGIIEHFGLFL